MPLTKLIFVATSLKTCQKIKMFFLLLFLNFFQIRIRAGIETTVIKAKPHLEPNTIGTRGCFDTRHYKSNYSLKESFRFNFNKVWQINFWPPGPWQGGREEDRIVQLQGESHASDRGPSLHQSKLEFST